MASYSRISVPGSRAALRARRLRSFGLLAGGLWATVLLGCDASAEKAAAMAGTGGGGRSAGGSLSAGSAGMPDAGRNGGNGGSGGAGGNAVQAGAGSGGAGGATGAGKFSFFVTSLGAIRALSGSQQGFGGDLRFGKATGLEGADEICRQTAERSLPGAGAKTWRAFLSATAGGPNGGPINAIDRVGQGPWYDRLERVVAMTKSDLAQPRPRGADPLIVNDLPNEYGTPNHSDGGCSSGECPDNHMVLTGSNQVGELKDMDPAVTCNDWTNSMREGSPFCGASWPRGERGNWMSYAADSGCAPCVQIEERGGPKQDEKCVGSAGGYGAIYCFALTP